MVVLKVSIVLRSSYLQARMEMDYNLENLLLTSRQLYKVVSVRLTKVRQNQKRRIILSWQNWKQKENKYGLLSLQKMHLKNLLLHVIGAFCA